MKIECRAVAIRYIWKQNISFKNGEGGLLCEEFLSVSVATGPRLGSVFGPIKLKSDYEQKDVLR